MDAESAILERIRAKDQLTFEMSDALDTKASIALVVITFLGTQTAWFVAERNISGFWHFMQCVSATLLVVAGILAIIALWPREYDTEDVDRLEEWLTSVREYYKDRPEAEVMVSSTIVRGGIKRAKERITHNAAHNSAKSKLIEKSFWFSSFAFGLNLLTVVVLTIQSLS